MRAAPVAVILACALVLASCAPPMPAGIQIVDAWARPSPQSGGATAVYFRILNGGDEADRLVGGRAAQAEALEIHETSMQGDMAHMAPVAGIDVPAGATVEIAPGGFHVMLLGLKAPLEPGDHVTLTLTFEHAGEIEVEAEVREP